MSEVRAWIVLDVSGNPMFDLYGRMNICKTKRCANDDADEDRCERVVPCTIILDEKNEL